MSIEQLKDPFDYERQLPENYKGCAYCDLRGPFKPALFRHSITDWTGLKLGTDRPVIEEMIEPLMGWVAGNGFVPESISFFQEMEEIDGDIRPVFAVRLVTRYVSYHSGWYPYMKDPKREAWTEKTDRPIIKRYYGGQEYILV